jgi:hypothetical protein
MEWKLSKLLGWWRRRQKNCLPGKSERAAEIGKGPMMSSFYVKIGQPTSMNPKLSAAIAAVIAFCGVVSPAFITFNSILERGRKVLA